MGELYLTCSNEKWSSATYASTKLQKNPFFREVQIDSASFFLVLFFAQAGFIFASKLLNDKAMFGFLISLGLATIAIWLIHVIRVRNRYFKMESCETWWS